jgi:acyl-CoA thioesterase YciA
MGLNPIRRRSLPRRGNGAASKPTPPARSASEFQPAIRVWMMPRDTNALGTIFGGVILSHIDQAGVIEAYKRSEHKLVTVAMHEVKFIAPVFVGDLVSFFTKTLHVGNSSITVRVTVEARRAAPSHQSVRVTQAEVVYVAVDKHGKPTPVRSKQRPPRPPA